MVGMEERHIAGPQLDGWLLHLSSTVWTGRKRRLMAEDENVHVASSVQPLELAFHPLKLLFVAGDIRVQSDHEGIAVTKGECRIAGEAAGRTIRRDQGGNGVEIISQRGEAFWVVYCKGSAHVMISRHQEVRDTGLGSEPVNQRHKTYFPLMCVLPLRNRVALLKDETHWVRGATEFLDLLQHRVHDDRMIVLNGNAIMPFPRVAIGDKRKLRHSRRFCLRREWRGRWGDGSNALAVLRGHGYSAE